MSALHTYQTEMTDACALAEAIGFVTEGKMAAEVFDTPQSLKGNDTSYWQGTAEVIIRRTQHYGWHDVGFKRNEQGRFEVCMSDMDVHKFNESWMSSLRQNYTAATVLKDLRTRGYTEFERENVKTETGVRVAIRAKTPQHLAPRQNVSTSAQRQR